MEEQQSSAEAKPSQALAPPDGQSMQGMQQVNPDGSVANTAVQPSPSMAPRKPQGKGRSGRCIASFKTCMSKCMKSFMVGLRKLWILFWKNLLLRGRSWILLSLQFLMMLSVFGFLYLIGPPRSTGELRPARSPLIIRQDQMTSNSLAGSDDLFFVSKNDPLGNGKRITDLITKYSEDKLIDKKDFIAVFVSQVSFKEFPFADWIEVSSEDVIESQYEKASGRRSHFGGGVIFEKLSRKEVRYKIRPTSPEGISGANRQSGSSGYGGGSGGGGGNSYRKRDSIEAPYDTGNLFTESEPGPFNFHVEDYKEEGVLGLQILIDDAAIKVFHGGTTEGQLGLKREITLKTFPYPPYQGESFGRKGTVAVFCCLFILYLVFSCPFLSINVGNEKETGVKELMKLCGYPGWMQWLAWYLIMFAVDLIFLGMYLILLSIVKMGDDIPQLGITKRPYLGNSDFFLCSFVLLLTMISINAFVIFICSLIKSTSLATIAVILVPLPIIIPIAFKESTSYSMVMAVSLLPHACFVNAFRFILGFEGDGHGAQWNLLGETIPNLPKVNLGLIILMFLIDIVLYQSLAVYFEAILPSEYGVRKPVYYPIQALLAPIMVRRRRRPVPAPSHMTVPPTESNTRGFEPDPDKIVGVYVQNMVKKFDGHKIAVNGVSLKMYDGEIFALLGHNGAGKTTLISMLTGLFAPTSGTAIVGGYDIRTDLDKVRQNLGLCPQHDMLFSNLTVMEHLQIFGRMKGQSSAKVKKEAIALLGIMKLTDKINTVSKKLSGGQKRKLCLGMALIGEAKVVILDEPTSGMDPEARRAIWDILLQVRGQRTILLTTHFMEEADVLGDRIGIMAEGRLQCCGSPSFLKSFYGTGYTLKVSLMHGADKNAILALVQKSIPDASLKPINMPNEVFIALPTETTSSSALSSLFTALTDKKDEMRIESLGLSVASMDEIFVKVGELSEKAAAEAHHDHATTAQSPKSKASVRTHAPDNKQGKEEHESAATSSVVPTSSHVEVGAVASNNSPSAAPSKQIRAKSRSFVTIMLVQSVAILIKRYICTKRKVGFLLFQVFVPASLALGAILFINGDVNPGSVPPSLKMGLDDYRNPVILYSDPGNLIRGAKNAITPSPKYVDNVERALKQAAKDDISFFRENIIAAGEIVSDTEYTAWVNTIPVHAAPLAINLASNIRGRELSPPIKFQMSNHPLKTRGATLMKAALKISQPGIDIMGYDLSGCMTTALLLFGVFFIVLPTEERLNKSRQLQLMTGIHPLTYWMTYIFWDFVILLIVTTLMIAIFGILESFKIVSSYGGLGAIFLVCLGYGAAIIPLAYLTSGIPRSVAGGVTILLLIILIPFIVTFCLIIKIFDEGIRHTILFLCRVVPLAGVTLSFFQIGSKFSRNGICNLLGEEELKIVCSTTATASGTGQSNDLENLWPCCDNCLQISGVTCFSPEPYMKWIDGIFLDTPVPGTGQIVVWLFVMSLIFQVMHITFELGAVRFIRSLLTGGITASDFLQQVDDEDVRMEEHRVAEMIMTKNTSMDALIVDSLCKTFGGMSAVSKLTFGVHHGECFGLLGTNGAGKTTTFRMITGDEQPSLGDVHESKFSLKRNRRTLISHIGYCPQFDAFIPYLTGRENLQLFARLRGIPWREVNAEANKMLESVGLTASGNVKCKKYSGGMKRRLSAAIAIIGNPALILLDEPTSGVDPVSRRQFWKVLESVKGHGQSIILTSHSMDECEALCARLGIMVNGQLQCIGGVQHLKHKFAQGYSLTLRLKSITDPQQQQYAMGMLGALNNEICVKFHPCLLKDQHETVLQYEIQNTNLGWNVIYNSLEEFKKSYGALIEDYSVSETSLEEVFLAFSRKQYPPRDSKIPLCRRIWTCQY